MKKKVKEAIGMVKEKGGIAYAREQMMKYRDEAMEVLMTFPDNEARSSLEGLVNFTIERVK